MKFPISLFARNLLAVAGMAPLPSRVPAPGAHSALRLPTPLAADAQHALRPLHPLLAPLQHMLRAPLPDNPEPREEGPRELRSRPMHSEPLSRSFRMAEREGALIQYLLRYIRGLPEPASEGHTLIVRREGVSSASFQVLTLHRSRHTRVSHVKAECAREFKLCQAEARAAVLRFENGGEDLADDATLDSLRLYDVTMLCLCVPVLQDAAPAPL